MKTNITSIEEMLGMLKSNPCVLGLVEYGSSTYESIKDQKGDYDLFVILKDEVHDVEVECIRYPRFLWEVSP